MEHDFDLLVIDSSPSINLITYNALLCATELTTDDDIERLVTALAAHAGVAA